MITTGFQSADGFDLITAGTAVLFFFIFIIMNFLISYNISLHQSLIAQSCWIMNKNRENSAPKNAILIILIIFALAFLSFIYFSGTLLTQSFHS
jgi:hypothetical protein